MIHTDQSPLFGMHVIHGLTDKFNHQRLKVYHLHAFWDSDNDSTDGYIHKVVKIPVLASILVNTVGYVLS